MPADLQLSDLQFEQGAEAINFRPQLVTVDPDGSLIGQVVFHTGANAMRYVDVNGNVVTIGADSGGNADTLDGQNGAFYLSRGNHTGTQAISTISGLQTQLDGKAEDEHQHVLADISNAGTAAAANVGTASGNLAALGAGGVFAPARIPDLSGTYATLAYADQAEADAKGYADGIVNAHAGDTNNPHGVTAEQAGALRDDDPRMASFVDPVFLREYSFRITSFDVPNLIYFEDLPETNYTLGVGDVFAIYDPATKSGTGELVEVLAINGDELTVVRNAYGSPSPASQPSTGHYLVRALGMIAPVPADAIKGTLNPSKLPDLSGTYVTPAALAIELGGLTTSDIAEGSRLYYTDARVRANRISQLTVLNASVSWGSQKITSLANGTNNGDAVNFGQLSSSVSGLASEAYVDSAISSLVDNSPGTLDTLNELAAALGDDPNFATTVTNNIAARPKHYQGAVPSGSADAAVPHNLGTKDVDVQVRRTSDDLLCRVAATATDANTVTLHFKQAPAANAFSVLVVAKSN